MITFTNNPLLNEFKLPRDWRQRAGDYGILSPFPEIPREIESEVQVAMLCTSGAREEFALMQRRPWWPIGKVSALGPEGSRFETRFRRRSTVYGACFTLNHTQRPNALPLVWHGSLERGASSGVILVI
ncbi:hypothetical protein AVEN_233642-1 [Araneus ventricosus]|uniref:Uncharacterized protein n=1 Tax=Araneus ventricosus TaxID=182803 RepID=A0A4Y2KPP4_ARAVE|nr:hypothetical protein AVEN_233642-1 [Araneus ventricosus]